MLRMSSPEIKVIEEKAKRDDENARTASSIVNLLELDRKKSQRDQL